MRRVWAAVLTVWALSAVVAVLAWTRPPVAAQRTASSVVVVRTATGLRALVVPSSTAHATTQTSPTSGAPIVQQLVNGTGVQIPGGVVHAVTSSS